MNSYSVDDNIFLSTIEINQDTIDTDNVKELKKKIINTKKRVIKEVGYLNKLEHIEIFKILKSNNITFTENVNGIFINLSPVNISILNEIILFINYVKNKNIELLEKENNIQKTIEKVFGNNDKNINNLESKIQMLKDNLNNGLNILHK
jgi:hypothetical protein